MLSILYPESSGQQLLYVAALFSDQWSAQMLHTTAGVPNESNELASSTTLDQVTLNHTVIFKKK